jgi:hypothetical protein
MRLIVPPNVALPIVDAVSGPRSTSTCARSRFVKYAEL